MTQLHIIMLNGTVVNLNMPEDFDLPLWIRAVRADGFVLGPKLYISLAAIAAVFVPDTDQKIEVKPAGQVLQ